MQYKNRLILNIGDVLIYKESRKKGPLEENELDFYDVLNSLGEKIGSVEIQDHTAI